MMVVYVVNNLWNSNLCKYTFKMGDFWDAWWQVKSIVSVTRACSELCKQWQFTWEVCCYGPRTDITFHSLPLYIREKVSVRRHHFFIRYEIICYGIFNENISLFVKISEKVVALYGKLSYIHFEFDCTWHYFV